MCAKCFRTRVLFLEASDEALIRRFSETRRPHPMGRSDTVVKSIRAERKRLDPIRNVADIVLDTTKFNVHDLRASHQRAVSSAKQSDRDSDDLVEQLRIQEWRADWKLTWSSMCGFCRTRISFRSFAS